MLEDNNIPMVEIEIVKTNEYNNYLLYSPKFHKEFEMKIGFYSVNKHSVGDILELPQCMLYMDDGCPMFSNGFLCLGKPNKKMSIPKDFDIRQDYAYLMY